MGMLRQHTVPQELQTMICETFQSRKNNEEVPGNLPKNIDDITAQDINYGLIEIDVINDEIIYKCKRSTKFKNVSGMGPL